VAGAPEARLLGLRLRRVLLRLLLLLLLLEERDLLRLLRRRRRWLLELLLLALLPEELRDAERLLLFLPTVGKNARDPSPAGSPGLAPSTG